MNPNYIGHGEIKEDKKGKQSCKKAIMIKIESSKDKIRSILENISLKGSSEDKTKKSKIIEVNLFVLGIKLLHNIKHRKTYNIYVYSYLIEKTIVQYSQSHHLNRPFMKYYTNIIYFVNENIDLKIILKNYQDIVIKNIEKDERLELYHHQKQLLNYYKNAYSQKENTGSIVLYSAPTGTGKTMTPLCLLKNYKIIFICAARHVGLTLANYMINMGKKVAFAFGCSQMEDIRLHFNAVSEYIEMNKTVET